MAKQSREGEVLAGKYRLEKLLGKGAVGMIYRAQNTLIGRTVAIKLLRPEHASDEEVVGRFLREARAANLVRHPNVVDVLDIGQDESGVPFIVEEFLEGEDLARYVQNKGGHLEPAPALDLLIPVAEAVGYAHSRGVIHRDLKPENVFLSRAEGKLVPKLLDFGLSRIKLGPGEIRATATGMTMGSPAYMSPEQIEGAKELDARADVWALGVILYEVLSGNLPFIGDSHVAVFVQISWAEPPRLEDLVPSIPRDLARVVTRCLRRSAADRYPTASELCRDLQHIREGDAIEPTLRHSIPVPTAPRGAVIGATLDRAMASTHVSDSRVKPSHVRPAASRGSPIDHHMLEFTDSERGSSTAVASGLAIATFRPPPMPQGAESAAGRASGDDIDVPMFWGVMAMLACAAVVGGAMMLLLHRTGGWPVVVWARALFDGSQPLLTSLVALVALASGVWLSVHALRSKPKLWALVLSSLGLVLVGVSLAARVLGLLSVLPVGPWATWMMPLIPCGLGLFAFRRGWETWRVNDRSAAVIMAAVGTAAIFVAGELLRAAF
ncbi:MAG: serine/threonine protein kinase [Deltaproteobacteria bacterium]|nr:serine/threonine protein kinase [Deltaproteobacteria bacterium]